MSMSFTGYIVKALTNAKLNQSVKKFSTVKVKEKKSIKMEAWQIHSYGTVQDLQLTAARYPFISKPDELLIKVHASSVNPIDVNMIEGYGKNILNLLRWNDLEFPLTLGRDFSGTIIDKGHGVGDKFKIGDEVYGVIPVHKQGCHSAVVLAEKSHILIKPQHLSHIEAASILYTSLTAWSALFVSGGLLFKNPEKRKILILGASGGVGTMAIQMLKSQQANVSGICSEDAIPLLRNLGADQVFDYRNPNYIKEVSAMGKFNIILDCANVGYQNIPPEWSYETYITLNSPLLKNTDKYGLVCGLITSAGNLVSSNLGKWVNSKCVKWAFFTPSSDGLKFIDNLVKNKQIVPVIHKVFNFSETPKAYEELIKGHARGKIIIDMKP